MPSAGGRPGIYSSGLNVTSFSDGKAPQPKDTVNYIEYIESTGTQYIDTGIKPTPGTVWAVEMEYKELTDGKNISNGMIVKNQDGTYNRFYFGMATSRSYQVGIGTAYRGEAVNDCRSFELHGTGKGYVNSTEIQLEEVDADTALPLRLFARNSNVDAISRVRVKARLYGATMRENGELVQDLRPCRDEDGVPCLYDTVTNEYFYNKGTGDFLAPV